MPGARYDVYSITVSCDNCADGEPSDPCETVAWNMREKRWEPKKLIAQWNEYVEAYDD